MVDRRRNGIRHFKTALHGLFWTVWLLLEALFMQTTVASYQENEPRAMFIFGGIALAILLVGAYALFRRGRAT